MVRVLWGNEITLPRFYLNLTPFLPQFYVVLTSFLPNFFLPQLNLCSAGNLEPRFGNHGLQILGEGLFQGITREIRNFSKMNSVEERFAICISARQEPSSREGIRKNLFFGGGGGGGGEKRHIN